MPSMASNLSPRRGSFIVVMSFPAAHLATRIPLNVHFHCHEPLMHLPHLLNLVRWSVRPRVDFLVESLVNGIIRLELLRQDKSLVFCHRAVAIAAARWHRGSRGRRRHDGCFLTLGGLGIAIGHWQGVIVDARVNVVGFALQADGRPVLS